MKLKTVTVDGKVYAEVQDGKPVYVHDDGKDIAFDGPAAVDKIKSLNAEAKGHREAKEAAEGTLKKFEGIEDPDAARSALEKLANIDEGKLVAAGKVEEIKAAAKKAAEDQVTELRKSLGQELETLKADNSKLKLGWDQERIGTNFANSKYVTDKLAAPGPLVQKIFGENFAVEDGKIVASINGNKIYSRENPGEIASFDEALGVLVDAYPFRDTLVRGSGGGSGGGGGRGNGGGMGAKELSRVEFDRMNPADRAVKMKEGFTIVDTAS